MEGEAFQKFVDLLAEDMFEAATAISDWLIEDGIPAFEDWMEKVEEAGGIIEWIHETWDSFWRRLRVTAAQLVAIVALPMLNVVKIWLGQWELLKIYTQASIDVIKEKMTELGARLGEIFGEITRGIGEAVTAPLEKLKELSEDVFEIISRGLSGMPQWFLNLIFGKPPGGGENEPMRTPRPGGFGAGRPDLGGGMTLNVYVTANGNDPAGFGRSVAGGMLNEMRRRGIRLPTLA